LNRGKFFLILYTTTIFGEIYIRTLLFGDSQKDQAQNILLSKAAQGQRQVPSTHIPQGLV